MNQAKKIASGMHAFSHNILIVINLAFVFCLLLGNLATIVPAGKLCILPYFGLFYPFWVLGNLAFLIYWIFRKKRIVILPLLVCLLFSGGIRNTFTLPFGKKAPNDSNVTILSFNMFGMKSAKQITDVKDFLFEQDADVVCLQEFGFVANSKQLSQEQVIKLFEEKYPYHHLWYKNQNHSFWVGNATFSKYPIVNKELVEYESRNNVSILSDIVVENDTIRVINNHLESYKLTPKEIHDLKEAMGERDTLLKSSTTKLLTKMNLAYRIRTEQAKIVASAVKESKYPVVVCGDFNDVPQSYAYHKIKGHRLQDLGNKSGWGYRHTYNRHLFLVNIDHILIDKHLYPSSYEVLSATKISDHYPVVGSFNIKK